MNCSIHYWQKAAFRCPHCLRPFCADCQQLLGEKSYCPNCGEEEAKMMALRAIVDTAALNIQAGGLSPGQVENLIEEVKESVLELFPGKAEAFELIYRARFLRLAREFGDKCGNLGETL
jgi:hypothetical protein